MHENYEIMLRMAMKQGVIAGMTYPARHCDMKHMLALSLHLRAVMCAFYCQMKRERRRGKMMARVGLRLVW